MLLPWVKALQSCPLNYLGHGQKDDKLYLYMEFCDSNLETYINNLNKNLPDRTAVDFLFQLSSGLAYLHGNGIVHRDLKPANVLMVNGPLSPTLKLADFGLSKKLSGNFISPVGTFFSLYMAPEIARELSRRSPGFKMECNPPFVVDIFSLGMISCFVLLRQLPRLNFTDLINPGLDAKLETWLETNILDKTLQRLITEMLKEELKERPNILEIQFDLLRKLQVIYARTIPIFPNHNYN